MVAIGEIILESKPGGKSTGRLRGTSFSSAAEVYPGAPWMVDPVLPPVPISRAFKLLSGCRRREIRYVSIIPRNAPIVTGGRCRVIKFYSAANSTLPH